LDKVNIHHQRWWLLDFPQSGEVKRRHVSADPFRIDNHPELIINIQRMNRDGLKINQQTGGTTP